MFGSKETQNRFGNERSQLSTVRMIVGLGLLAVAITSALVSSRSKLGAVQPVEAQAPRMLSVPHPLQTRYLPKAAGTTLPLAILPRSTDYGSQATSYARVNWNRYSVFDFLHQPSLRFHASTRANSDSPLSLFLPSMGI